MSKIRDLIKKLCPNGVEYKSIDSVADLYYGKGNNIPKDGGDFPVYGCYGIVSTTSSYNNEDTPIVGHIGSAGKVCWGAGKHYVTYNGTICKTKDNSSLNSRYLYYVLLNLHLENYVKGNQPFLSVSDFGSITIPMPPIEVQEEIVKILDKFEKSIGIIWEEQKLSAKQYDFVVNKLLMDKTYKKYKIKDICKISKGKSPIQKTIPGEYPMVVTTEERKSSNNYQYDTKAVCVPLVSSRGHGIASLNHVYYQEGKFALGNILCAIEVLDEDNVDTKYLYYFLESAKDFLLVPLMKGGANVSLHMEDIYNIEIFVPDISKQKSIVYNLDKIINYQSILKNKLELIKKQYEYYRNKLLSFEELSVSE